MPKAVCPSSCPRQELDALQQVWEITRDWEESWNQWKTGCFLTLQTEAMESMAHGLFRRLTRLAKEYKVRGDRQDGCVPAEEVGRLQRYGTSDVFHLCSGPKLGNYRNHSLQNRAVQEDHAPHLRPAEPRPQREVRLPLPSSARSCVYPLLVQVIHFTSCFFLFHMYMCVCGVCVFASLGVRTHVLKLTLGVLFDHSSLYLMRQNLNPELPNSS